MWNLKKNIYLTGLDKKNALNLCDAFSIAKQRVVAYYKRKIQSGFKTKIFLFSDFFAKLIVAGSKNTTGFY